MFCPNCGNKLPNRANFCTVCGKRITPPAGTSRPPQEDGLSDTSPIPIISAASAQTRRIVSPVDPNPAMSKQGRGGVVLALVLVAIFAIAAIAISATVIFGAANDDGGPAGTTRPVAEDVSDSPSGSDGSATDERPVGSQDTEPSVDDNSSDPEAAPQDDELSGEYVLADSSVHRYTTDELSSLSDWELYLARNEIYARHGREFSNADLRRYFEGTTWYQPSYTPEEFDAASGILSGVEQANIDTILSLEQDRGSAYL